MRAAPPLEGSVAGACGKGGRAGRVGIRPRRRARDRFFFEFRQGVLSFSPRRAPAAHHPCFSLSSTPQTVGNALSIAPQAEAGARLVAPLAPALVAKALLDHRDKVKKKRERKKGEGARTAWVGPPRPRPRPWHGQDQCRCMLVWMGGASGAPTPAAPPPRAHSHLAALPDARLSSVPP